MIDRVKGPLTSISLCSTSFFPSSSPAISAFFPAHYSHAKDYFRMGERQLSQKIANYTDQMPKSLWEHQMILS